MRCIRQIGNVVWWIEIGIDATTPGTLSMVDMREIEISRLPVGIYDEMQQRTVSKQTNRCSHRMRIVSPVGRIQLDPVPFDRLFPEQFRQCHVEPLAR